MFKYVWPSRGQQESLEICMWSISRFPYNGEISLKMAWIILSNCVCSLQQVCWRSGNSKVETVCNHFAIHVYGITNTNKQLTFLLPIILHSRTTLGNLIKLLVSIIIMAPIDNCFWQKEVLTRILQSSCLDKFPKFSQFFEGS